jgi:hypothetical protein
MDEQDVRDSAQAMGDALVAGNIDLAIEHFSEELHRNIGEVLALLPLPATEATIESVERAGPGFNAVLKLVGESEEVEVQTRWKERDGRPTMIEASHLSSVVTEPVAEDEDGAAATDTEGETPTNA